MWAQLGFLSEAEVHEGIISPSLNFHRAPHLSILIKLVKFDHTVTHEEDEKRSASQ